eukprot:scaffold114632_cov51-Phaeocystis_antarctica.AAC.2
MLIRFSTATNPLSAHRRVGDRRILAAAVAVVIFVGPNVQVDTLPLTALLLVMPLVHARRHARRTIAAHRLLTPHVCLHIRLHIRLHVRLHVCLDSRLIGVFELGEAIDQRE